MSRSSRKSDLSPSSTGINLGKNDVDTGRKTQPSATSGGVGVSTEITNVGGVTVTGGVSVDISPIDLGISYDPAENSLGIGAGAEIPGGLLGVSGGVEIDLNTGEIVGGSVGAEVVGLGVSVSNSTKGGLGVSFSVQIPFTPIEFEIGLGFPPKEKPALPTTPTPKPKASPGDGSDEGKFSLDDLEKIGDFDTIYVVGVCKGEILLANVTNRTFVAGTWYIDLGTNISTGKPTLGKIEAGLFWNGWKWGISRASYDWEANPPVKKYYAKYNSQHSYQLIWLPRLPEIGEWIETQQYVQSSPSYATFNGADFKKSLTAEVQPSTLCPGGFPRWVRIEKYNPKGTSEDNPPKSFVELYQPTEKPPPPPPFPNPPPTKRNMNECCRDSIKLQRLIVRHLGAARSSNPETLPDGAKEIGSIQDGIRQAYPFVVKKRWVDPNAKENEGITILNDRQLALTIGGMIERLERVLGTAEFYKDSDKKLRQSEGNLLSWLTGKNKDFKYPDPNDFWMNSDDGVINEKLLEVRSIADGLRYQIEALNRLERILPIAELKDSSIPARWIYPKGEGQLRVGNLIHLCEYMIRKSDKDMGYWPQKITIKAANPAIKDDEPITADVHSQADMLRVILQQVIDIEGDGDMGSNYDLRRTYLDIMALQLTVKNNKYLQAITEYLSFDMTEEVSKIPIPFDPFAGQDRSIIEDWWIRFGFGEEKLSFPTKNTESEIEQLSEGLLQNSELEVNTVKFGSLDQKKDPKTLKETLIELLKHSSAASAAVTEVATEGALERIVDAAGLAQKLTSFLLRRDIRESLGIGDLDTWMASAEKGYTDDSGTESLRFPESNPFEPYGRPATQNPVIREIDTKEDRAD